MKKVVLGIFLIISIALIAFLGIKLKDDYYYIKKDAQYQTEFLCFLNNKCYYSKPSVLDIKNKKFVTFANTYYYDINSYQYNKKTKTYSVDVLIERDPSGDLGICNKSPYDNGNITHLLFNFIYNPSKKVFKAKYIGFVSSKDKLNYKNNKLESIETDFIEIYYDNNPNLIKELKELLNYYNNEAIKTFDKEGGEIFDVEIAYILKRYLDLR